MKSIFIIGGLLFIAVLVVNAGKTFAADMEPDSFIGTIIWIADPKEVKTIKAAMSLVEEAGFKVTIIEAGDLPPTEKEALEILLAYRALTVVWHTRSDFLNLIFLKKGEPDIVSAESGSPNEESLFLRELLLAKFGLEEDMLTDLLLTIPEEYIEYPISSSNYQYKESTVKLNHRPIWSLGVGYNLRVHLDAVTWAQRSIGLMIPTWRFSEKWLVRAILTLGFPTVIGESNETWLEIKNIDTLVSVGFIPLNLEKVDVETGLGFGFVNTFVTAFLSNGEYGNTRHVSGQARMWIALLWYASDQLSIRTYTDMAFVFGAPSVSINGKGDFGEFPLQWGAGLDIEIGIINH